MEKYRLEKKLTYIGSEPGRDIVLEKSRGRGVEPLHVQLIATGTGYRLVNLAPVPVHLGASDEQQLPQDGAIPLSYGDSFRLGDFTLGLYNQDDLANRGSEVRPQEAAFHALSPVHSSAEPIGLSVYMPTTLLIPEQPIEGIITIHHRGEEPSVKIELAITGIDPKCVELSNSGPLLSSNSARDIRFSIHHRRNKPPAGPLPIMFHAAAPKSYPGCKATQQSLIQVTPVYQYQVNLFRLEEIETRRSAREGEPAQSDLTQSSNMTAPPPGENSVGQETVRPTDAASLNTPDQINVEQEAQVEPAREAVSQPAVRAPAALNSETITPPVHEEAPVADSQQQASVTHIISGWAVEEPTGESNKKEALKLKRGEPAQAGQSGPEGAEKWPETDKL